MRHHTRIVTNADELQDAVKCGDAHITVKGEIRGMPMLALQPGQTLTGGTLYFGARGVQLSRDNTLSYITIRTSEVERAILNNTDVPDLGTLTLHNVRTTGQVALLIDSATRSGLYMLRIFISNALICAGVPSDLMHMVWMLCRVHLPYGISILTT